MSYQDILRSAKDEWESLQRSDRPLILVGTATCGRSAGALEVLEAFKKKLKNRGINCNIIEVGCIGLCYAEPLVTIIKPGRPGICYHNVTCPRVVELDEGYLLKLTD